jgi:hypothetical protein
VHNAQPQMITSNTQNASTTTLNFFSLKLMMLFKSNVQSGFVCLAQYADFVLSLGGKINGEYTEVLRLRSEKDYEKRSNYLTILKINAKLFV